MNGKIEFAGLPDNYFHLLTGGNSTLPNKKPALDVGAIQQGVPEGQRDDSIFRYACRLRHDDVYYEKAVELILELASKCHPPFPSGEAIKKVDSAYDRYPSGKEEADLSPVPDSVAAILDNSGFSSLTADSDIDRIRALINNVARLIFRSDLSLQAATREAVVKKLTKLDVGSPARIFDAAVLQLQEKAATESAKQNIDLSEVEPWIEKVDGCEILNQVSATISRFVVMPSSEADATALWLAHTHATDAADIYPILVISSPRERCGKSRLLEDVSGG
jgi:hypothetical protein